MYRSYDFSDSTIRIINHFKSTSTTSINKLHQNHYLLSTLLEEAGEILEELDKNQIDNSALEYEINDLFATALLLGEVNMVKFDRGSYLDLIKNDPHFGSIDDSELLKSSLLTLIYYASKGIRFGLVDIKPGGTKTNSQEIEKILRNLVILTNVMDIPLWSLEKQEVKIKKIITFYEKTYKHIISYFLDK